MLHIPGVLEIAALIDRELRAEAVRVGAAGTCYLDKGKVVV